MNPNFNDEGHSVSIRCFKSEINDDDVAENSYEIDSTGFSFGYGFPLVIIQELILNIRILSKMKLNVAPYFSGLDMNLSNVLKNNDEVKANY